MGIDIVNESGVTVDAAALSDLAGFTLSQLRIHPAAELSILLVDRDAMSLLHERWMGEPGPTDVLSFEMDELRPTPDDAEPEPGLLGDIVLCPQVAEEQAAAAGHPVAAELALLTVHGILHLLGFDHAEDPGKTEMFTLQTRLLGEWAGARGIVPPRFTAPS